MVFQIQNQSVLSLFSVFSLSSFEAGIYTGHTGQQVEGCGWNSQLSFVNIWNYINVLLVHISLEIIICIYIFLIQDLINSHLYWMSWALEQWWIIPSYWQETNEICYVLQMLALCETSPFSSISQVSVSGFQTHGSHLRLSLGTRLWPCLKHVICKRLCGTMHYLKTSLIASRITRPLTVCMADESREPWTSADSTSLLQFNSIHITTPVNISFYR